MRANKVLMFLSLLNLVSVFLFIALTAKQCKQNTNLLELPQQDTIVTIDTTPPPPIIIRMPRQPTPKAIIVYIDSTGRSVPTAKIDTSSIRLGLHFVSAKGWAVGYDYDLLQNVHSVNIGVRLFGFEAKMK